MTKRYSPEEKHASSRQRYMPIRLSSLGTDNITEFGVYMAVGEQQVPVLYCGQNVPFPEDVRQRLLERGVAHVFIERHQEPGYRRYVERGLAAILANPVVDLADKAELLYYAAEGLMEEVLEDPRAEGVVPRSRNLVQNATRFLFEARGAFAALLSVTACDYTTRTHGINVLVYCLALAQRLGISNPAELQELGEGALLHDLGKSLIDPRILHWPGKLSASQWAEMARHPLLGCEVLHGHGVTNERTLGVVRHHHEKIRGGGYPDGLVNGSIPEFPRICAVADVFDALTTRRPYRRALRTFAALDLMCRDLSEDLDRDFVRAFVEMMGNPGLPKAERHDSQ